MQKTPASISTPCRVLSQPFCSLALRLGPLLAPSAGSLSGQQCRLLMPQVDLPDALGFPDLSLEPAGDPPSPGGGFLRVVSRRLRVRYPDGTESEPFVYDEVARRALDATVIAAHYEDAGEPWVYLRSALRPPVRFRDPARSPVPERQTGALWELPAGLIEPEETGLQGVLAAARRELFEELGFDVPSEALEHLGPATFPCPGIIGERHFFVAVRVDPRARKEPCLDGSALERFGRVVALPLAHALELCRSGIVEDSKTELGLLRLSNALSEQGAGAGSRATSEPWARP